MNRVQDMNFLVTNSVAVPVNIILVPVLLFRAYPSVLGEVICHPTNERIFPFQMVGVTHGNPEGFGDANGSSSQRPPPPPPNFAEYLAAQTELLCQLILDDSNNSNSSEVDPMFINLKLLVTRNSWQLSPLCSTRQKSHWMRMLGFAQSSPSFHYFWRHAQSKTRLALPHNSFAVRRVFGGITILACSQLTTLSLGMNSRLHSRVTIFQKDSWKGS